MTELEIVPSERHVVLAAREGRRAETRRSLLTRLSVWLGPVRFAGRATRRIALFEVLPAFVDSPVLEQWADALDPPRAALADLAARVMPALDERLARAGLVDERLRPARLALALTQAQPLEVARVLGATRLRARHVLDWEEDAAWWCALGGLLRRLGGEADVELPVVVKPVDATRTADPFEAVVASAARALDEAPLERPVTSLLGDLTFTTEIPRATRERVTVRRCSDAEAQAKAALLAVREALTAGCPTDRVGVMLPLAVPATVRRATTRVFDDAGVALHFVGAEGLEGALAGVAFSCLAVGQELPRLELAALLRSRILDATRLAGLEDVRAARAACLDLADALERTPSTEAETPLDRFVATAAVRDRAHGRVTLAERVGRLFATVPAQATRAEHARASRALFAGVGLVARPSATVRRWASADERRAGIVRAELEAHAHDARALEAIAAALDELEHASLALGDAPCSAEVFRFELGRAAHLRARPSARAGAVRAARVQDFMGDALDLAVVLDANAGGAPGSKDLVELATALEGAARIVVCHRSTDDDGAALAPAPFVSWLVRGGVRALAVHAGPLATTPLAPADRTLALVAVAPERATELVPHAARVAERERAREAFHTIGSDEPLLLATPDEALHALLEAETGGASSRALSVTAVERLARCKFQGYAAHVLGALDDDPRVEDMPDRREEGTLTHEALGAAFSAAARLWPERPRDRAAILVVARAACDAVLGRTGDVPLLQAMIDRIRVEVMTLVHLALDDEDWDFLLAEQGFGLDDPWGPLVVGDVERVSLRGRIDRIDRRHDGGAVRVVDYKRSVTLPAISDLGGAAAQIPLYALVARRNLAVPGVLGRYLSTVRPSARTTIAFEERLAELLHEEADGSTEVERAVLAAVVALRHGDISPRAAPKWCAQCRLDGVCRRPRFGAEGVEDGE